MTAAKRLAEIRKICLASKRRHPWHPSFWCLSGVDSRRVLRLTAPKPASPKTAFTRYVQKRRRDPKFRALHDEAKRDVAKGRRKR